METWRLPGNTYEVEEQIWIKYFAMQLLRSGRTFLFRAQDFWIPRVKRISLCYTNSWKCWSRIAGGAPWIPIPRLYSHGFIRLFYLGLTFWDRTHAHELHVLLMLSSALSWLGRKDMTIWKSSGQLRLERRAYWAIITPFPCLWSFNLKTSFSVFSLWLEQRCHMCLTTVQ